MLTGSNEPGVHGPDVRLFDAVRQITQVTVRYADTDAAGIVHYAKYLAYLEAARAEALRAAGLSRESVAAFALAAPVVQATLRYRSPARFDESLDVTAWVSDVSEMRCRWRYEIHKHAGSDLVLTAETEHDWSESAQRPQTLSAPLGILRALNQLEDAWPG